MQNPARRTELGDPPPVVPYVATIGDDPMADAAALEVWEEMQAELRGEPNNTGTAATGQPAGGPAPFTPRSTRQLRRDAEVLANAAAAEGTPMSETEAWIAAHRQEQARAEAYLDSVGLGWVEDTDHDTSRDTSEISRPGRDAWSSPDPAMDAATARRERRYAAEAAENVRQRIETENAILAGADRLDPDDHSLAAEQLRETAEDIRDHREAAQRRGDPVYPDTIPADVDPFTSDAMRVVRGDDLPPAVRFGQMSDARVEAVRSVLATLPDQFTLDDLTRHGITLDEASLVYMADHDDMADPGVTDPWRPAPADDWSPRARGEAATGGPDVEVATPVTEPPSRRYTVLHEDRVVAETESVGDVLRTMEQVARDTDTFPTVTVDGDTLPDARLVPYLLSEARPAAGTAAERDWAAGVAQYMELQLFPPDDVGSSAMPADWHYADAGAMWGRATGTPPPQVVLDALHEAGSGRLGQVRSDIVHDAALAVLPDAMVINHDPATEHRVTDGAPDPLQFELADITSRAPVDPDRRVDDVQTPAAELDAERTYREYNETELADAQLEEAAERSAESQPVEDPPSAEDWEANADDFDRIAEQQEAAERDSADGTRPAEDQATDEEAAAADAARRAQNAEVLENTAGMLDRAAAACARIDQALAAEEQHRVDQAARARAVEMTHDDTVSRSAAPALEVGDGGV